MADALTIDLFAATPVRCPRWAARELARVTGLSRDEREAELGTDSDAVARQELRTQNQADAVWSAAWNETQQATGSPRLAGKAADSTLRQFYASLLEMSLESLAAFTTYQIGCWLIRAHFIEKEREEAREATHA